MLIANPIYDVVFKYLMDDARLARMLISAIIGEEVISLQATSNNIVSELIRKKSAFRTSDEIIIPGHENFTILRLDYTAVVKTPDGEHKKIIIEIQKAKLAGDIMRFRYYLGSQYMDEKNMYIVEEPSANYKKAMPIVSLYFLGYPLRQTEAPVIKVARNYIDLVNNCEITVKEEFIESLTHDSYVIQIPFLKPRRQSELLRLLSIFDQDNITESEHVLNVKANSYPEKYRPFIRRLRKAAQIPEVRIRMEKEDRQLNDFLEMEKAIIKMDKILRKNAKDIKERENKIKKKDKILGEKDKALGEKDKALGEKDKALGEKDKALDEKDKALDEKNKALYEKDKAIEDYKVLIEKQKKMIEAMRKKGNR